MENTTECIVTNSLFKNSDGNALMLSGFNQYTTLAHNEFTLIGDTAMAAWGFTEHVRRENIPVTMCSSTWID